MERLVGIEPTFRGWQPRDLPLIYNRLYIGQQDFNKIVYVKNM